MKFDPFSWNEVKTNDQVTFPKGRLRLRLSAPAPLYIQAEGVEALAGYAAEFDVEVSEQVKFRVEAGKGVRAFLFQPFGTAVQAEGETFTNIDRMPMESGMLAEVTRARRQLEIERRSMLAEIRAEGAKAKAALKKAKAKADDVPQEGGVAAQLPETDQEVKPNDVQAAAT